MLEGIDVSNWQGRIDWRQVRQAGKVFAWLKCSEGTHYADPTYLPNFQGAKQQGILPCTYHFARPLDYKAEAEAEFFLSVVGGPTFAYGEAIALDMEPNATGAWLAEWALEWLAYVGDRVGFKPLIYSAPGLMQDYGMIGNTELAHYGLWLASWQDSLPAAPACWPVVAFWQYTDTGVCPGIQGACDLDRFNGTVDQMMLYGAP